MKSNWKFLATIATAVILGMPLSAWATSITINNASFENPPVPGSATYGVVDDWVLAGAGGGVWDISSDLGGCPGTCWSTTAPDLNQIGWLSVGPFPGAPASMTQTLGDVLVANRAYTLSGFAGHPINFPASYTAELIAGSTVLASVSGTGPAGAFEQFSFIYFSGNAPEVGQLLQIRLSSTGAQTGFDAIALSEDTITQSIPDGGMTALLLGLAITGLGVFRRATR